MTDGPAETTSRLSPQRKKWLIRLTILFLILGLLVFIYWLFIGRFHVTTDDAYVGGNQIEVMPLISGHVTEILAEETNLVTQGEPLIKLDKADADVAYKNAEAHLALTVRQVSQLYQNVNQAKSNVLEKQANLEKAQEDLQRRRGLIVDKDISKEELQHAKIAVDDATAALNLAKDQLAGVINLVSNSNLYNHPQVMQAADALRNAYLTLYRTTIYSPVAGYVAKRFIQVGQHVATNTVLLVIVPLNQIWVDANFKETQLENIRIGQPASVSTDLYGDSVTFDGVVMGLNPGTGSAFDLLPPQNATGNWIKIVQRLPVRIILNKKQLEKHPLRIGLSVTATIYTYDRSGSVLTQLPTNNVIYQTQDDSVVLKKADEIITKILQDNAKNVSYP